MASQVFTDQNFEQEVLKSDTPVIVDFWAEWCQPCKLVSPTVDQLAEEYKGKVKIGKLNVDENSVSANYNVMSIPTIMIFKDGQPVKAVIGAKPKEEYKRAIEETVAS
jgi:thioredoxin 1